MTTDENLKILVNSFVKMYTTYRSNNNKNITSMTPEEFQIWSKRHPEFFNGSERVKQKSLIKVKIIERSINNPRRLVAHFLSMPRNCLNVSKYTRISNGEKNWWINQSKISSEKLRLLTKNLPKLP